MFMTELGEETFFFKPHLSFLFDGQKKLNSYVQSYSAFVSDPWTGF